MIMAEPSQATEIQKAVEKKDFVQWQKHLQDEVRHPDQVPVFIEYRSRRSLEQGMKVTTIAVKP